MRVRSVALFTGLFFAAAFFAAAPACAQTSAQNGKLKIHVSPKQAYVFVDGKAIRDGSQTIDLPAGTHSVGVYNYGYLAKTQDVQINAGESKELNVALPASGEKVSGPFSDIEFNGHPRAAVLLNGTTPDYFVGHVDEFDWDWIWHQRLLVKPGTYHVIVTQEGNTIWSGDVTAKAGQRTIIDLNNNGAMKTKEWKEGLNMGPQPRFHAGVASATVPIAPVSANLTAQQTQLNCGQSTELKWNATDAASISITDLGNVPAQGDRTVSPTKNTTYELTATGPGGTVRQDAAVAVNSHPTVTLTLSQPEVRYHKVGDKVVQQDATTLNWSVSNANSVRLDPFGSEGMSGSQTIEATPRQTNDGPVNENVTYTLTSANACGGTTTRTATLHVIGSIDPAPGITIASVFYPTDYPRKNHPKVGLVRSEEHMLAKLATDFQAYTQYEKNAKLTLVAHADVRASKKYNRKLSERRAVLVKDYLVAHGIAPDKIETRAMGKEQQLDVKEVEKLQMKDSEKPEKWMMRQTKATWLAYNRRVDVVLEPNGQQSAEAYPNDEPDARILWVRKVPSLKAVESAAKMAASVEQARASSSGN